jgi:hypothetical protein
MRIAHVSDFHVSRYGNVYEERKSPLKEAGGSGWETLAENDGWRVEIQPAAERTFVFRDNLRLVDDDGLVHHIVRSRTEDQAEKATELGLVRARKMATTSDLLAQKFPTRERTLELLQADPDNANLRFCLLAHTVRELNPDWVVITGDLTEDAVGFELVSEGFRPFVDRNRLLAIPGNHDIYPSMPFVVARSVRKSEGEKRKIWSSWAASVGVPSGGSFLKELGDGLVLMALDSCHPPKIPHSASGMIDLNDLHHLTGELESRGKETRIACLHHHIVNPPVTLTGAAPLQAGMRLRNAKDVVGELQGLRLGLVLNGHRHMGYRYHPARSPLFLSSPSSTLGCRTGLGPYFWLIDVAAGREPVISDVHVDGLEPVYRS